MALYSITSGKTAAASNAAKVAIQLATGAGVTCKLKSVDFSFDGVDSSKTPVLCEIVRETGASSTGGAAGTLTQIGGGATRTVQTTARTNDTTDGASPTVLYSWLISPTAAFAYQFPLGNEVEMGASSFLALRVTTVTASGSVNYQVGCVIEE